MIERAVMRRAAQHKLVLEATERGAAAAVSSNSTGAGVVEVVLQPNAEFVYDCELRPHRGWWFVKDDVQDDIAEALTFVLIFACVPLF